MAIVLVRLSCRYHIRALLSWLQRYYKGLFSVGCRGRGVIVWVRNGEDLIRRICKDQRNSNSPTTLSCINCINSMHLTSSYVERRTCHYIVTSALGFGSTCWETSRVTGVRRISLGISSSGRNRGRCRQIPHSAGWRLVLDS